MTHFVLVHGICHGAWCWYRVIAHLKSAGHLVTPLDLGASGINSKQLNQLSSYSDYAQPLMEFMADLPEEEKVILAGHSFGGIAISLAMEKFPSKIAAAVYVTGFMPNLESTPATAILEFFKSILAEPLLDLQLSHDNGPEKLPTTCFLGPNYAVAKVYQNSPKEDLELAQTVLRQGKWFIPDLSKDSLLTKENFGSVHRVYVVCNEDLLIKEELQKWYIEHNPTQDVKVIAGADHMPMFSKPQELCQALQEIAQKYE
ncbi:hypothetical protein SLE2022_302430 [Rubroshorea leprosula]